MPSRRIGSSGRPVTKGRPIQQGSVVGKGPKTRAIAQPPVKRIYDHCLAKNKQGLPCGAPNIKGEPYCIGHHRARLARSESG